MQSPGGVIHRLCFQIGGITIAVDAAEPHRDLHHSYPQFLVEPPAAPDVLLRWQRGLPPDVPTGTLLHCSEEYWALYRANGHRVLTTSLQPDCDYLRVAFLEESWTRGDLYYAPNPAATWPLEEKRHPFSYPLDQIVLMHLLADREGIMFHACGVIDGERGYVFIGSSGAGKSTTARLWAQQPHATVLSDDRVIVRRHRGGRWRIYGTPWYSNAGICTAAAAPLAGLFVLSHGTTNTLTPLRGLEAVAALLRHSIHPTWDLPRRGAAFDLISQLVATAGPHRFAFVPDNSAIRCIQRFHS